MRLSFIYNDEVRANLQGMRERRLSLGIGMRELNRKIDGSIYKYEHGISIPSLQKYNKLAEVLGWNKLDEEFTSEAMSNIRNMKLFRREKGVTQLDLSISTGITVTLISFYERGQKSPCVRNYNRLAKFFGWKEIDMTVSKTHKNKSSDYGGWNVADQGYERVKKVERPTLEINSLYIVNGTVMIYTGKTESLHKFVAVKGGWSTTLSEWQLNNNIKEVKR